MKAKDFFDIPKSLPFQEAFLSDAYPWEWIPFINVALKAFDYERNPLRKDIPQNLAISGDVYIDPSVQLPPYGSIEGPVYIGAHCELRPGVYIRGNVIVGERCVLGNACEYKNCLLMDSVQTPHYNYVGDSILGTGSHLGAGVILANLRLDKKPVTVEVGKEKIATGLTKFGSVLGEFAKVGCNTVLQPGTLLAKKAIVGPCKAFGGNLREQREYVERQEPLGV